MALALCAFPDKQKLTRVGLATLVASVLGAYVDKTEQCSDWERRPLTTDQVDYAAADAHVLTVLFDRCFNHAPAAVAEALADPAAPLARAPGRTEADERTRSRAWRGEEETRRRERKAAAESAGRRDPRSSRRRGRRRAPTRFPRWSGTCSRGGSRWRRRLAAEKAAAAGAAAPTSAATFFFVNVGRTNRRYANEFWVEEVPGSNPTSRGVVMSWFPGGGGLREIASALVDVPSEEGVAEGSEKSVSAKKTPLLFLRPAKERTRASGGWRRCERA